MLWLLPLTAFLVELISIRLAVRSRTENQLWSQMLSWVGAISAVMNLTTLVRIIMLVI